MALGLTHGQLYYSTNGLADSSVEHEELLKIHFFQTWPVYLVLRSQSLSMLEVIIIQGESGKTHFSLAFEAPSGWLKEKEANQAIVLTVLQVKKKASGAKKNGGGAVQNRNGSRTGLKW
ncbi:hypothetical protein RHSIM_RhsimUnG0207900 [Rhododendron simsii]|uniref:Uncharacterized protein n=1 Tax=Rhododendron simsii TaxID=118357 RepID=A0A834L415_RHOSS|nr:hypothetical protein RHSIM_RhsimUnG0207900 [Rhododendron simsii]